MGVVECISPPMCGSQRWIIHTQVQWWISYIGAVHYVCRAPFQISGNASDIWNLFMCLGLAVLQKYLTDDYRDGFVLRVWRRPGCPPGLTSFLFDIIILLICTFTICTLAIFNSWLSSKDMKLRVLIKEVLVVFYGLTFRIIYIYTQSKSPRIFIHEIEPL